MAAQCACTDMTLQKEPCRDPSSHCFENCFAKQVNPRIPDYQHKTIKELPWIHGWQRVQGKQKRRGSQPEQTNGESCLWTEIRMTKKAKEIRNKGNRHHQKFQQDIALVASLKACAKQKDLWKGSRIHADILKSGLLKSTYVGTALVNMYAKCGSLAKAQEVFDELPFRDVVSWSALIAGYSQHGHGDEALKCLELMRDEGHLPNMVTFTCILQACGSVGAIEKGKEIHAEVVKQGLLGKDVMLGTALVDMYAKCGALAKAHEVFRELPTRNVVSWNALIAGFVQHGCSGEALGCFDQMEHEGLSADAVTFTSVLKACGSVGAAVKGEEIHAEVVRRGLLENCTMLGTALVDMYAKCGALAKAQEVFDELPVRDVVSWSALIAGYAEHGHGDKALNFFEQMQNEGISPNVVTFTCLLKACSSIGAAEKGQEIHAEVLRCGLLKKSILLGTAVVDMYAKCGALAKAREVFDELPVRDVVSWNVLIAEYSQHGYGKEALNCFEQLQQDGLSPNAVTFACSLNACSCIGAADKGQEIHAEVVRLGLLSESIMLGNALVDMYAKCGVLAKAQDVFEELPFRDVVSWSALIAGYAQHGHGEEALNCFKQMQVEGLSPDSVTFTVLLNACNHSGLVDEGQMYFTTMNEQYGVIPNLEHHTCMVDLFGRAGHADKAIGMIEKMPPDDCHLLWFTLLGACQKSGNVTLGRLAFKHIVQLDEKDAAAYVCMSNIYAAAGMPEEADKVEVMRVKNGARMLMD